MSPYGDGVREFLWIVCAGRCGATPLGGPVHDVWMAEELVHYGYRIVRDNKRYDMSVVGALRRGAIGPLADAKRQRRTAIPAHTISTTPKGQAPLANPYALDRRQPAAKARVKLRWRCSRAYIVIMKVTATTPNSVTMSGWNGPVR